MRSRKRVKEESNVDSHEPLDEYREKINKLKNNRLHFNITNIILLFVLIVLCVIAFELYSLNQLIINQLLSKKNDVKSINTKCTPTIIKQTPNSAVTVVEKEDFKQSKEETNKDEEQFIIKESKKSISDKQVSKPLTNNTQISSDTINPFDELRKLKDQMLKELTIPSETFDDTLELPNETFHNFDENVTLEEASDLDDLVNTPTKYDLYEEQDIMKINDKLKEYYYAKKFGNELPNLSDIPIDTSYKFPDEEKDSIEERLKEIRNNLGLSEKLNLYIFDSHNTSIHIWLKNMKEGIIRNDTKITLLHFDSRLYINRIY